MGDQDQGRSGLNEQSKSPSLNKKSREVCLERQTSARESQIAELRSVEATTSPEPKAKSKSEDLQKKFDDILHEAELKLLLGVTLESLHKDVLETEHSIARDINATIDRLRTSFPLKDKNSTEKN